MDNPGYIILSRLGAQLRATQVVANNLANTDTPGFRAERPIFAAHLERQPGVGGPPGVPGVAYTVDRATWRDTASGPLNTTGNPLDVAIQGDGFFAVETAQGERFTRAGRFTLHPEGRITDLDGNAVLDVRGTPIAVSPNDTRLQVMGDGTIRSENGPLGRLRVVRFADPQALRPEGDRMFASDAEALPVERPAVVQGAIEGSNVRPVLEITRMTAELREFQFAAQFAEREGERLQSVVERILRRRS